MGGCLPPTPPAVQGIPDTAVLGTRDFAVYIEQDDKLIAVKDHTAVLRKASFTLVLVFPSPSSVLVNCADTPGAYDAATGPGRSVPREIIAEAVGNPQHQIMLTEQAYHQWYVSPGTAHTFESITLKDGIYHCRRTIDGFVRPGAARRGIESLEGDRLYFAFYSEAQGKGPGPVQRRERLKIEFR